MRDRSVSPSQSPTSRHCEFSWHNHKIRLLWVLLAGTTRVDGKNLSTSSLRKQGPIASDIDAPTSDHQITAPRDSTQSTSAGTTIRYASLAVGARAYRAHGIALAQQCAGAGHDDVAFVEALADFDIAAGHQPDLDPPRLHARSPHHLHHGAGAAVENGRERHRDVVATLPGFDRSAA